MFLSVVFISFFSFSYSSQFFQINIKCGKHLYPIHLIDTCELQIFHKETIVGGLKVFKTTHEVYIDSPIDIQAYYSIVKSKEELLCPHCQFDCNNDNGECTNGMLKGIGTFTFDTFVDLLMPTKSLLIFIIFAFLVIVSACMICTMTCRFVDCFTDILCNKAKARQKQLEKQVRENMKESNKRRTIELVGF